MSARTVYLCDRCGTQKLESNHWFAVVVKTRGTILSTMQILAFMDAPLDARHLCGEQCLQREVAVFTNDLAMESNRLEKQSLLDEHQAIGESASPQTPEDPQTVEPRSPIWGTNLKG